jgi:hypothetical protein
MEGRRCKEHNLEGGWGRGRGWRVKRKRGHGVACSLVMIWAHKGHVERHTAQLRYAAAA